MTYVKRTIIIKNTSDTKHAHEFMFMMMMDIFHDSIWHGGVVDDGIIAKMVEVVIDGMDLLTGGTDVVDTSALSPLKDSISKYISRRIGKLDRDTDIDIDMEKLPKLKLGGIVHQFGSEIVRKLVHNLFNEEILKTTKKMPSGDFMIDGCEFAGMTCIGRLGRVIATNASLFDTGSRKYIAESDVAHKIAYTRVELAKKDTVSGFALKLDKIYTTSRGVAGAYKLIPGVIDARANVMFDIYLDFDGARRFRLFNIFLVSHESYNINSVMIGPDSYEIRESSNTVAATTAIVKYILNNNVDRKLGCRLYCELMNKFMGDLSQVLTCFDRGGTTLVAADRLMMLIAARFFGLNAITSLTHESVHCVRGSKYVPEGTRQVLGMDPVSIEKLNMIVS